MNKMSKGSPHDVSIFELNVLIGMNVTVTLNNPGI